MSKDDIDKFEEQEKKKIRPTKKNWYDWLIKDIRTFFEQEEVYYELKRVINFWNNNCIEYESNGDKNRNLSLDEYLRKIKPYLRNIIIFEILTH